MRLASRSSTFACVSIVAVLVCSTANAATDQDAWKAMKTMADMRSIATAWEAFGTDWGAYTKPETAARLRIHPHVDEVGHWSDLTRVPYDVVQALLTPVYIHDLPQRDGWGNPFDFAVELEPNLPGALAYYVRSLGANGRDDDAPLSTTVTIIDDPGADVVISNGSFIVVDRRIQRKLERNDKLRILTGAERIASILEESGVPYVKSGNAAEWIVTAGERRVVFGVADDTLTVAAVVKLSTGQSLSAEQLQRLLRLQSSSDGGWDLAKIVLLGDGSPAVRLRAPSGDLTDDGLPRVLAFITEVASEIAKMINSGSN